MITALAATLAACASAPAPDINGRWKPVNRYADTTQEIPLRHAYVFSPSPADGTLKTMLERWARDSKRTLLYLHSSDFTLYAPVVEIRTSDLQDAIARLSAIYAPQQVVITADNFQITVHRADPPIERSSASAPGS